ASTSLKKKKSKTHKSHKVKDTDTPPLVSVSTFKKEKQSLKPLSQDEQSRLEKIIKKLLRKCLMKSLALLQLPLFN
ncbi:2344_t:CDS:1, partial [Dentiscutata erythropus]